MSGFYRPLYRNGGALRRFASAYEAGVSAPSTIWNPSDKAANIVLSNGNLTVSRTGSDGQQSVRATQARSSGKYYYEAQIIAGGSRTDAQGVIVGVGASASSLSGPTGGDATSWGYAGNNSTYNQNLQTGGAPLYTIGDVIGVAVDFSAGRIWFALNNVYFGGGSPASGTGGSYSNITGTLYPMVTEYYAQSAALTAHFVANALVYAPPTGFTAWGS